MKRLFRVLLILSVMLSVMVAPASAAAPKGKAEVCHNGKTISVSVNAVAAHVNHGDAEGACP